MAKIQYVRKRDGRKEEFDISKIRESVEAAFDALGINGNNAAKVADAVAKKLEQQYEPPVIPTVEDIDDLVQEQLKGFPKVAQAYRAFKHRDFKTFLGIRDELMLSSNALLVLANRYLLKDDSGKVIETPLRMFNRVAQFVAHADSHYEKGLSRRSEKVFFDMMSGLEFLPNSPTLMNAGTELGQLSACYVLPIEDSLDSIFETLKD
ncbi:hypothetical protein KY329_04825, partial [Candidatus Woesearchaeota archaeon]|nr:hypothetical protein [Candidatus Woesearchaeota archaeon]